MTTATYLGKLCKHNHIDGYSDGKPLSLRYIKSRKCCACVLVAQQKWRKVKGYEIEKNWRHTSESVKRYEQKPERLAKRAEYERNRRRKAIDKQ